MARLTTAGPVGTSEPVKVRCAQCHTVFEVEGEPERCPSCKAEAGLERVVGVPGPMRLFGFLLATVIAVSVAGGVISRIAG